MQQPQSDIMTENTPMVSFVLPAYKLRFLKEAIDSILGQTDKDFHLIIVNDKSPEDIRRLVATYDDSRIEYHENEVNLGRADLVASWNQCLQYAQSEYVCLASDDDVYSPTFLAEVKGLIRQYPACDLIRGRVQKIDEHGNGLDYDIAFPECQSQSEYVYYYSAHAIRCAANYVYRLKSLKVRGGFVSLPCGWFTDIATPFANSANGVLNTQNIVFRFRLLKSESVSSNVSLLTVKKKLLACQMYYKWLCDFFATMESTHCTRSAHYTLRSEIIAMLKRLMKGVPLVHLSVWYRNVFANKMLYGREKAAIMLGI